MSIVGFAGVTFGAKDLAEAKRFLCDFGLPLHRESESELTFRLDEGSTIAVKREDDTSLPPAMDESAAIREIIWGVDSQDSLDRLEANLSRDFAITKDGDGTLHFLDPSGIPTALRVFARSKVRNAPDPVNAPDVTARFGKHRRWRKFARPKVIQHVVFRVDDSLEAARFYMHRLNFRLSDISRGVGYFMRAEGLTEHHSIFFLQVGGAVPGCVKARPDHISFGVEDLDEMMVGANHMDRQGWTKTMGLGRHRLSSSLFYFLDSPFNCDFEYGTDNDHLDDNWQPMEWDPPFGMLSWFGGELPHFWRDPPNWKVNYVPPDHPIYRRDEDGEREARRNPATAAARR